MKRISRKPEKLKKEIIVLCLAAVLLPVTALLAKYVGTFLGKANSVTSEEFYFSTSLTGDPAMVNTGDPSKMRATLEDKKDVTWALYGGEAHEVQIDICNYLDDFRISGEDIEYTVSLSGKASALIEPLDENLKAKLPAQGEEGAYEKTKARWKLSVKAYEEVPYEDGTVLTVTIQSTKPYRTTIKIDFLLYTSEPEYAYAIVNHGAYYEMILMAEKEAENVVLYWPEGLAIDHTNPLTYVDEFQQMDVLEEDGIYEMTLSRSLKAGESVSILFFVTDTSKSFDFNTTAEKIPMKEERDTSFCATYKGTSK